MIAAVPGNRSRQRLLVFAAVLTVVSALAWWPDTPREAAHAVQACGAGDANRASLTTENGRSLRPCLSKVDLRITVPPRSYTCGFIFTCWDERWRIEGISRSSGTHRVVYADGTAEDLYRLTFRQFTVANNLTMATAQVPGGPIPGYTLTLKPALGAQLGGTGSAGAVVYTDMWVTADSMVRLNFNILGIGYTCNTDNRVDELGIASVLTVSVSGCGMDLHARYVVTTAETGDLAGQYSVKLPDTKVTVS